MKVWALFLFATVLATLAPAQSARPLHPEVDVFLITIDTLRADHVGCYGYKDIETPTLDSLAADGVRFSHAYTPSPITSTSHATILTGLLPSVHGVTDFGVPLAAQHATWAELLKKQGYQTAAFIGAVILDSNQLAPGFDRGFDFYDNFPAKTETKERWGRVERRAMDVIQQAESWLDKHPAGPHFMWIHLYDPHDPYEPPPPFAEKYAKHPYDGEIAYADSALGHFIGVLKKSGVYRHAIVVVAGDHGEGLGEHGEETHGLFLYDSTLHVPLIVKMPDNAHRGMVVDTQVLTIDILPTVLSVTGNSVPAEMNGESLETLINGQPPLGHPLLAETDYPLRWGWAPLRALREDKAKFIEAPRPELYDMESDPHELKNLYGNDVPQAQSMRATLAESRAKLPAPAAGLEPTTNLPDPKDKIEVQNLLHRAMLASDDGRTADAQRDLEKAVQVEPDSAPVLRLLGELELAAQDYPNAATHLKRAVQLRPQDSTAAFEAGQALEKTGDFPGARDVLEAGLKQVPTQTTARLLLGRIYLQLRDAHKAEDQFEAALLMESNSKEGKLGLADAQIMNGDFASAARGLEELTKSYSDDAAAWRELARAYRGLHRENDAAQAELQASALEKK
jgi:arylsulfatase A-like enzyme/Tfp pilus assembly protein PilF